jgi:hypothetical protein
MPIASQSRLYWPYRLVVFSLVRRSVPPGPSKSPEATYFDGSPTEAAMARTWSKLLVNQLS